MGFATDSGILPAIGFYAEMFRIVGNRFLPEVPDESELRGCLHRIFDRRDDWRWLAELPDEDVERLWRVLEADPAFETPDHRLTDALLDAVRAEAQRNSLRRLTAQSLNLLALRVTDNAARTGGHYITTGRDETRAMLGSAMGAGFVIAAMALLEIPASKLAPPLAAQALAYSLNYGLGFVLIYMLHFTIATKQPAMTAQTIAGYLGADGPGSRGEAIGRIVDLIAAVSRSQIAAIVGNVVIALPTAMAIGLALQLVLGHPPVAAAKGDALIAELNPLGVILGLPIDIRHIAFSSANLGYAMVAHDFRIDWHVLAWSALGVAIIGFVNLSVSFALALWMALEARAVVFTQTPQLLRALWGRLRTEPGIFFRPPRAR